MADNTLFRRVLFGGYHKGDVLSYIENLEAEKESLKFSLQEAENKEPEFPPELKAQYETTIAQLQDEVTSLKQSSQKDADRLCALREETVQITRRQKKEAEDLIRTLQGQVMETLKQFPERDSTLQRQIYEQEGRLKAQSLCMEEQSARIRQQNSQLESQAQQIETLLSDISAKEKELTTLQKQLEQSKDVLQQVQQSLEKIQLSTAIFPSSEAADQPDGLSAAKDAASSVEAMPPKADLKSERSAASHSTVIFPTVEAKEVFSSQTDDSLPALEDRLDKLFSDTLNNLDDCEKSAQNNILHLVKSIS